VNRLENNTRLLFKDLEWGKNFFGFHFADTRRVTQDFYIGLCVWLKPIILLIWEMAGGWWQFKASLGKKLLRTPPISTNG
jgi:hypothetical protein